jgi:hypothetical protein
VTVATRQRRQATLMAADGVVGAGAKKLGETLRTCRPATLAADSSNVMVVA